ncbi:hypothetical protein TSUD_392290 [Trifolium subterraneum]|uniref:RNase H type-1 domain-containing protein n=1 Tax=Trifolium subterraneum TaxID=3900 RepID=A0A2Z6N127_TRISU|nr:hypothetical protein TSUD_392290 [Trifolium subterraneum]
MWKNLTGLLHSLNIYEFWAIGNGNSVSAWHDRWLFSGKSIEEFGIVIPDNMQQWMVNDLVNANGFWKLESLSTWLPQNIISKLFAIVPPNNNSEANRRAWSGSSDGSFTIASSYTLLCHFNDEAWDAMWLHIWRLKVPERNLVYVDVITQPVVEGSLETLMGSGLVVFRGIWGGVMLILRSFGEFLMALSSLMHERGYKKIELHIDSNVVVQTLHSARDGSVVGWRIIQEIRRLFALDWDVKICHSYRETNVCVDALANLGCDHGPGLRVYEQYPPRVSSSLLADVMGITTPRVRSL